MADNKLLPCPFCGSTDIDPAGWASTDRSGPACNDCAGCADTIKIWNTRAKQHLTSDPAGPREVAPNSPLRRFDSQAQKGAGEYAKSQLVPLGGPGKRSPWGSPQPLPDSTYAPEPEPVASVPVTDETIEDALHPILRPHFSTPLLGPILDECSKAILALLAASTGARATREQALEILDQVFVEWIERVPVVLQRNLRQGDVRKLQQAIIAAFPALIGAKQP